MKPLVKVGRWLFSGLFIFGMVTSATAQIETDKNDPNAPGSVLVYPYFLKGGPIDIGGVPHAKTEIEVSVTCPRGQVCQEGARVKLIGHWVCPADQNPKNKYICRETNFVIQTTVDATVSFNPDNNPPAVGFFNSTAPPQGGIRTPQCNKGYLILWVVDQFDRPIKFDGLIGDAVVRANAHTAEAYNAIPIQAAEAIAHNAFIDESNQGLGDGQLRFDGTEYKMVTGTVIGSVRYDERTFDQAGERTGAVQTNLILLTLDVLSNRSNAPTFANLYFYNQFEVPTSTFVEFICWGDFPLSKIDNNLTRTVQGSRKGYFKSDPAEKVPFLGVPDPQIGPVTLLGIVVTRERGSAGPEQSYSYSLYNDGIPVPTYFEY
jgi:hypothetical protein